MPARNIVINGDSVSYIPPVWGRGSWTQYLTNSGLLANDVVCNYAQGGKKIITIRQNYSGNEHSKAPGSGGKGIYLLCGGSNDIADGRTAAQLYDDMSVCWDAARGDGFLIVAFTLLPSTDYTVGNGKLAIFDSVNASIRANAGKYDFLIPLDTELDDPAYFADAYHTTPLGAQKIWQLVRDLALADF